MKAQWQKYMAEFFGTFVLVFVGSASILAASRLGAGIAELVAPFGFGLALLAGLYAFAETSGGHFNPAVSLALFLDRRLSVTDLAGYWLFQFAGATAAAGVFLLPYNKLAVRATETLPGPGTGRGGAVVFEIVLTAVFVLTILQVTKSGTFGNTALVAIPLTLVAIHFAAVTLSGASVNPARSFGPALVGNHWTAQWIYFLGPAAGAILGWLVHTTVVEGDVDIRDNVAELADDVAAEMEGAGRAVTDDQPAPEAPEWGTETDAGEPTDEPKT